MPFRRASQPLKRPRTTNPVLTVAGLLNVAPPSDDTANSARGFSNAGKWSQPRTIVSQRHFFRQAAEIPSLVSLSGGTLAAEWIEGPASGGDSEAEFVWFTTSHDGVAWSKPVMANRDKTQSQHGLASIVASGPHEASIIWLQALKGDYGPTSLMRTVIDASGRVVQEEKCQSRCLPMLPHLGHPDLSGNSGCLPRPHGPGHSRHYGHPKR